MIVSLPLLLVLLLWGTIVGLDVVTVPQSMVSRPLVAGTVTGLLIALVAPDVLNPISTGMLVGAVLELYALDVLPFGASRYPDYGPATVSAVYATLGWQPRDDPLGGATAVGLLIAVLGGWTMQMVRRANAEAIHRSAASLAAGDTRVIRNLQLGGIRRDIARSAGVTACGFLLGMVIWSLIPPGAESHRWISVVAVGGGVASALGGAIRSAGRTRRLAWVMAGLAGGILIVGLQ